MEDWSDGVLEYWSDGVGGRAEIPNQSGGLILGSDAPSMMACALIQAARQLIALKRLFIPEFRFRLMSRGDPRVAIPSLAQRYAVEGTHKSGWLRATSTCNFSLRSFCAIDYLCQCHMPIACREANRNLQMPIPDKLKLTAKKERTSKPPKSA